MQHKEIAEAFSGGKFELVYPFLAEDASWNIAGERILNGKADIMAFCDQTAAYFAGVTTVFTTGNIIAEGDLVAIDGTAVFINKENKKTSVSSCDVYRFADGKLAQVNSYCITTGKE